VAQDQIFDIGDHVRCVSDPDGTTILDLASDQILALNTTGAFIWRGLQRGNSFASIAEELTAASGADPIEVQRDAKQFIEDLVKRRLVSEKPSPAD
jgi:hypothetical protein